MLATLIQIDGWDPEAGAAVTLRAASHDDPRVCHLDEQVWWPSIAMLPKLRYDFFSGSFDGQIDTPSSSVTLITEPFPMLPRLSLADARLRLWTGEVGDAFNAFVLRFDGIVTAQPKVEELTATIDFAVDDRWLDTPLLALYAGTTGLEGEAGQKGTPKPLSLGQPRYVPGVLIDSIDTVLQLSAYGVVEGIDAAMERLNRFPVSSGDYPNLAALKSAVIPRGGWATCKALGLVRHGAPIEGMPSYLLRGDAAGADGWARTPGELIRRIADIVGAADRLSDASLTALDVARPWNLSLYLADQLTARDIIQRIAASVNAVAGVSWLGELFVAPIAIGTPGLTLRSDGTALPVTGTVKQVAVGQPYWRIALQAQRTWQMHALSDIAFSAVLLDRGRYDAEESYREGDVVDMADGSRWLHIGTVPTEGVAPGSDPTVWFNLSAAIDPADIRYDGGAGPTLQDLKPAEPGATAGAPAGSYVADMLAEDVLAQAAALLAEVNEQREQVSTMLASFLQNMMLAETREARAQAISYLDGDALHTVQRRETVERIEGDTAIVTDMALIGAKSLDGSAWILDLSTVKVGPTETFGERLSEIDATFTTVEAAAEANHTELTTAIASEASARVTAISTLTASVGTLASNTAASIVTLQAADATEASARASAITSLTATVTTLSGTVTANYSSLVTAVSNETSARVSALSSLTSTVTTLSGTVSSNYSALNSAISSEASARASADTALTATIGGVSATVTTHSSAITSLTGRTTSYWEITTNAGSGATAFIAARAETSPGSVTSNVAFGAREVHISNPIGGAWTKVLSIVGGEVNVYGKLTATGAVTTPNIVANNVTQMESSLSASAVTSSGGWENILGSATWHTFELDHDAEVLMLFTGRLNYFGSTPSIVRMTLYNVSETYLGAIEGPSTGDGGVMPNPTFPWKIFLAAGIYHVAPQFLCDAGDAEMRSGSGVIVFWRYC